MDRLWTTQSIRLFAVMSLLTAAFAGAATAQNAQLQDTLSLVPPTAPVAIVVPNMAAFSGKVARFNGQALDGSVPELADVLGMAKQSAGITQGIDDNGPFLMVITDVEGLKNAANSNEPPLAMFVPVTDYKTFLINFQGASLVDADRGITSLSVGGGSPAFARSVGRFALIAPTQKIAASFQPGGGEAGLMQMAGKLGTKCLTTSDAVVIVNVRAIEPVVRPQLQAELAKMNAQLGQEQLDPAEQATMALSLAMIKIYGDSANALLRDTDTVVTGLGLDDQGVSLTYTAQFKKGSHMARVFTEGGPAAALMAKLPNQPYLIASSMNFAGINRQLLSDSLSQRMPQPQDDGAAGNPLMGLVTQLTTMIERTKGVASFYAPPAQQMMMMGGGLSNVSVIETDDPQAYKAAFKGYLKSIEGIVGMANNPAAGGNPAPQGQVSVITRYTPDAQQVDGVSVDQYAMQVQYPPAMMQQMGPMMPLVMMLGGAGSTGFVAAKDNHLIVTTTPDVQLLQTALASVGKNTGLGTGGVIQQARQAAFGGNPSYETYISIPGIMSSANMFMAMMGMPPIQVPEGMPPVSVGGHITGNGVSLKVHTPIQIIRFGYDTANNFMDQQMAPPPGDQFGPDGFDPDQGPRRGPPPAPF